MRLRAENTRDRQVGSFWEVSWTAGPYGDCGNLLARRKQWRSHSPPDEPGDKCTVMHDLQELSGHVRTRHARQQDEFWRRVKRHLGELDLRDNERLCPVALVKRLFPKGRARSARLEGRSFALAVDGLCRRRALDTTRSGGHARPGARLRCGCAAMRAARCVPDAAPAVSGFEHEAAGGASPSWTETTCIGSSSPVHGGWDSLRAGRCRFAPSCRTAACCSAKYWTASPSPRRLPPAAWRISVRAWSPASASWPSASGPMPPAAVQAALSRVPEADHEYVELTEDAVVLANLSIDAGAIGAKNRADAQHITVATVSRVGVLVSWNFRHIVNLRKIQAYNSVNLRKGYPTLEIRTPREVIDHGQD